MLVVGAVVEVLVRAALAVALAEIARPERWVFAVDDVEK